MSSVEHRLDQAFESEKLSRLIKESQDLNLIKEIALSLVIQLAQAKAAKNFLALQAAKSENEKLEIVAEFIKNSTVKNH